MKIPNLLSIALAAFFTIVPLRFAHAQTPVTYTAGDLLLGFRATSGSGSPQDYVVDIGQASVYKNAASAFTVSNLGNIGADLVALFGPSWFSRSDVLWSVSGTPGPTAAGGDPARTLYATTQELAPGTLSSPRLRANLNAQAAPTNAMTGMAGGYAQQAGVPNSSTANSPVGVMQNDTDVNSYASYETGGSSFAYFSSPAIEGDFTNGTAGSVLDLNRLAPGSGAGTIVGSFTIDSSGVLTFTPASVAPNPGAVAFGASTFQAPEVDGSSNLSVVPVTFTRTGGSTGAVSATLAVTGGSLVSGTDYQAPATTISFADGATTATVNIQLKAIAPASLPGTIILGLSSPTGGATLGTTTSATVTINPVAANVHFTVNAYSGNEADGPISIGITRDGNLTTPFTVNFSTGGGTATAGVDYTAQTNTPVSFAASDTTKTVMVDVAHLAGFQGNRTFGVNLTSPSAGATVTAPATATVTILEAEPAPAGALAFSTATVQANALNGANAPNTIPLTLTRTAGTTGAVTVDVTVTGGTLVNGTDYTFTSPTTASFADGVATATVNIPLKANIAPASLPGTIVLGLSNPTNSATLGAITGTTVTVISPGLLAFSAPIFTFNPVDNHAAPSVLAVTLNRASGLNGPVSVDVSVSGGSLLNGTDYTFTSPTTVNFADGAASATLHIPLKASIAAKKLPGSIILNLTNATGGAGLGAQVTATVKVAKRDLIPPTVVASAPLLGAIVATPFTLTGKAFDAAGIDRVEVTLNGGAVQLATLGAFANGKVTYSLAGLQPENGKNTLVITAVDSSGNRSLPLIVAVTYLNNRPAFAGTYNGLLVPAVTPAANNISGLLKLTVTATGTFTGSAALGGFKVPLKGVFGNDGTAHFKPTLTSLPLVGTAVPPVALGSLELAIATDNALGAVITGSLTSASTLVANVRAPRSFFNGKTPATTVDSRYTLLNKGHYTLIFPAKAQGALPTTAFPQGDGYATLTLTAAGTLTITGKLADGVAFSAAASLAEDYSWPFFAALPAAKGSLAGLASFDDSQAATDVSGPNLLWLRAAKPTSKYYPAGWPTGLQLDLVGAKFVKTVGASVIPGLPAADPANGNATLVFEDGKLTGPLTKNVNIAPTDLVKNAPATDKTFTLVIVHGTGAISGTFKHTDNTRPAYSGMVYQKGLNPGAYGFFLSTVPAGSTTGESGGVSLNAK